MLGTSRDRYSVVVPAADNTTTQNLVYVGTYTAPNKAPGGLAPSTAIGIYVFKMDPTTGGLTPVQVVPNQPNPSFLALDPQMHVLYATNEVSTWKGQQNAGGVTAFAVDPTTGMLTLLNDQPSMGAIPAQPTTPMVRLGNLARMLSRMA